VLGIDDVGREVLSFIEGTPAFRPWPEVVRSDTGLRAIGQMLRELSEALSDFAPPPESIWRTEPVAGSAAIRHGDVGPWNMLWDGDELVGIVDWDFAEPAPPLWDIAQTAWYTIPIFGGAERSQECGFVREPDRAHRLGVLCTAYGAEPADVLDALADLQRVEQERLVQLAAEGEYPFTTFLARGDNDVLTAERARLTSWRSMLLAP
jgi:Ser/Thr protein kinase RdoA (MazF antagonist)